MLITVGQYVARVKCIRETDIAAVVSVTRVVPREYNNPVPEYESIPGLFAWLQKSSSGKAFEPERI